MNEETKPDWFLSNLYNQIPEDTNTMRQAGDYVSGFELRAPDDYWNLPDVRKAFTDEQEQPRKELFEEYYNAQKEKYKANTNSELLVGNFQATYANKYAAKINAVGPKMFTLKGNPDPWGRSYLPATGWTDKTRGWREFANETGVRLDDGSYVSPDEFEGYAKYAQRKDGSFDLNEAGRPYLVPVKDGEELKSYEQIYNSVSDWFGYYGHDYEPEQVPGYFLKNLFGFIGSSIDSMVEYPKVIIGDLSGKDSESYKSINDVENWAKSLNWGKTERGQDFFSFENLTDLGFQVSAQLAGMYGAGALTTVLTGSKVAGSVAGRLFMTSIAAGEIAEIAREENLTYKEQATLLGIYSLAIYGLAGLSEGVIKGFNLPKARSAFRDMLRNDAVILKGGDKNFLSRIKAGELGVRSLVYEMQNAKFTLPRYAGAAAAESLEESAEAVSLTGLKAGYNIYNDYIDSGQDRDNKFNIDWVQEWKHLGQSAIGGAIGGTIAKKIFSAVGMKNPKIASDIWEMVVDGKEKILYESLEKYRAENKLGLSWKAVDGTLITKEGGDGKVSENETAYNIIKGVIDYNVELRDTLGLKDLYRNNKNAAQDMAHYLVPSSMGKEASHLSAEVVEIEGKITEQAKSLDQETLKQLNTELELKRKRLGDIVAGRAVDDYIAQGIYNFAAITVGKKDSDLSISSLNGKEFVDLHKTVIPIMTLEQTRILEEMKELEKLDASATIDSFEGVTQIGKARILGDAQVEFTEMLAAFSPELNVALGLEPNDNFLMDMNENDLLTNLASIAQTQDYPESVRKKAAEIAELRLKIKNLTDLDAKPMPKVPVEDDFYLNMIEHIKTPESQRMQIASATVVPIKEMIDKELEREKQASIGGVSLYTNSDQLRKILKSIQGRLAQLKGTLAVRNIAPDDRVLFVRSPENPDAILENLKFYEAEVQRLLGVSEDNLKSSDVRVKQATVKILRSQLDAYEQFAEIAVSNPDFRSVKDIYSRYSVQIEKVSNENDIDGIVRALTLMESETYNQFQNKRDKILALYENAIPEKIDLNLHNSGKYSDVVSSYNYIRGVLAVDSATVITAYEKVIDKSNTKDGEGKERMPATNQDLIVKLATQALLADTYLPPFYINSIQNLNLHNTVMVHSEGGAGKTSQIIPLVVAVIQEMEPGSKTFLTSKSNDNGSRVGNMRKAVKDYFTQDNGKVNIDTIDANMDILEFLDPKNVKLHDEVNLVVFDEATLLTYPELVKIANRLNLINTDRKKNNKRLMKLLLTGDVYQNNISTNKANPDTEIHGIGNQIAVRVATTPEMSFSFRSLNQALKLFNDYVRASQFKSGYPDTPFITEYSGTRGVRVYNEKRDFEKHVASIANELRGKGELNKAVYITDRNVSVLPPEITSSGIKVLSSEAAQGNEWDYVFFDPQNNNLFAEGARNIAVKKDFYTASTRAKRYFAVHMPKEQNISSRQGAVYDIAPLSPEQATKQKKLESLSRILEGIRKNTSNAPVTYTSDSYTVYKEGQLMPESASQPSAEAPPKPSQTPPASPTRARRKAAENPSPLPVTPPPAPASMQQEPDEFTSFLLASSPFANEGKIPGFTFFTPGGDFDRNIELKKKAIYEAGEAHQYFITIAKIGTPEYHNVLNNEKLKRRRAPGTYLAFVEAYVDGEKTIVLTLPDHIESGKTLDEFVREQGLVSDKQDVVSFKISPRVIVNAESKKPSVFRTQGENKTLKEIRESSRTINFGKLKIYRSSEETYKKGRAGRAFVPVSFYYTAEQIDAITSRGEESPYITFVPLNYGRTNFEHIASILSNYIVTQDGKRKFRFDGEGGVVYDAMWGNMAKPYSENRNSDRFRTLGEAFSEILARTNPGSDYHKFLRKYATGDAGVVVNDDVREVLRKEPAVKNEGKAKYFMADFLETTDSGKRAMFMKAVDDLLSTDSYRNGFRFDLVVERDSSGAGSLYTSSRPLPQEITDDFLEANIDYISPPILKLNVKDISESIVMAKPDTRASISEVVDTPPIDANDEEVMEEFTGQADVKSLIDFRSRFFPGEDVVHMRPTLDLFRRNMFDYLFKVKNTKEPVMNNINTAIANYKAELLKGFKHHEQFGYGSDAKQNLEVYKNNVILTSFDWLLSKYYPAVRQLASGDYAISSSHFTDQSWVDKENYSHIHQGMTEMVKMLVFNTPLVTRQGNKLTSTGRYLANQDIEEVINEVKRGEIPYTVEEFGRKLSPEFSNSIVANSIYYRFFSQNEMVIDGVPTMSLSRIQDDDVRKMLDALRSFFLSGQAYALSNANLATGRHNLPTSVFGTPNMIRQHGYESMNAQAQILGKEIIHSGKTVRVNGQTWMKSAMRRDKPYSDEEVIEAMQTIGLTFFTDETLKDLYANGLSDLSINLGPDSEQRVRNRLIDDVFFDITKKFKQSADAGREQVDNAVITSYTNAIFKSVSRRDGINNILMYQNLDGKKVYRLRNTAPIFTISDKLAKITKDKSSPYAKNTFLSEYSIRSPFIKEGFKGERNGESFQKSARRLFPDEMFELDFFWGFLDTIEKSYNRTGSFHTAAFPLMVYSDANSIIDVVVDSKSGFLTNMKDIAKRGFDSQKEFYLNIQRQILSKYVPLGIQAKNVAELKQILDTTVRVPIEQIERIPGMILNRDYVNNNGFASVKQTLIDDMKVYNNFKTYLNLLNENYKKMRASIRPKALEMLKEKISDSPAFKKFTPEQLLGFFYVNWVTISNDVQLLTNGPLSDFKGRTVFQEYIEMVKRAKSEISTHSVPVLRNASWMTQFQQFIASGGQDMKTQRPDLFYEGHKLARQYKVAFVHDPVRTLMSLSGEIKDQDVYDGATFVTPLTRIFQRYSNGHEHGMLTPPAMKNITTYTDLKTGNKMFIKNAEFLLTPEIMRNGTPLVVNMVKNMLAGPAWEHLMAQGVTPDLSNITQAHFENLADYLVETGQQDNVIHEVVPSTSVKTGRRATTQITDPEYIAETIEISSKGTQLDASKDPYEGLWTKTPTQMVSSMSTNWKNPEMFMLMSDSLSRITESFLDSYRKYLNNYDPKTAIGKNSVDALTEKLRSMVRSAIESREGILYVNRLVQSNDFSLDDRQILENLIANLNSEFSREGVTVNFRGGHYVVHPSDGIIEVYDTPSGVKLKSQLSDEERATLQSRPLKWVDPVNKKTGESLSAFREKIYLEAALDEGIPATNFTEAIKGLSLERREEIQQFFDEELRSDNWDGGEAEILLPAEMMEEFMLEPGKALSSYNRAYFASQLVKRKKYKHLERRAEEMFTSFQERLHSITGRIPNTGPHSAVATRVVGFVNDSKNSVFVPSMLLFIQGADQDIDKGAYLTYETIRGIRPIVNDDFELLNVELFTKYKPKNPASVNRPRPDLSDREYALVVAYKNKVVDAIRNIMTDSANLVASNISVDSVMSDLKKIRDRRQASQDYNRYDYTSLTRMIQVNQSGKRLVGIFANGLKAYQNLYSYYKMTGKPGPLGDLSTDFNRVWITFAAFINAATDNAKEQILGAMEINDENAGMIAYLIAKGYDANRIDEFLTVNKEQLERINDFYYYDSELKFNPKKVWGEDAELTRIYTAAQEYRITASTILNRGIPPRSERMYGLKNSIETWVKEAYEKVLPQAVPFDLVKFMNSDEYARQHIKLYDKVIAERQEHEFNFLEMIQTVPHLKSYMRAFTTSFEVLEANSKAFAITNRIADEYRFPEDSDEDSFVKKETYMSIMDFTYGGLIDAFFKSQGELAVVRGYNLATPEGRTNFVKWMNNEGIKTLQSTYPENTFIQTIYPEPVTKRGNVSGRLRTYELNNIEEEKLLEMQAMMEQLTEEDRDLLVKYGMIVDKNRGGKGSWNQLLEPGDLRDFNNFLNSVNPYEIGVSVDVYRKFSSTQFPTGLAFNAIPYDFQKIEAVTNKDTKPEDVRGREVVQVGDTLLDILRDILPSSYTMSIKDANVTFQTSMEIRSGKVKSKTTVYEFLKNIYDGNRPESADLDPADKRRIKGMLDYYEKRKNEINFTYEDTRKAMRDCGITIKAK